MNIEVTSLALTLRVRGVVFHAIKQYFVFGLQPFPSFACTHSTLKPTDFKVAFCSVFWLFAFVNALHFVVKPHKLGFHNYAPFSTNKSLAQRYCPYNTFDNTLSLYTSSSPRTPSHHAFVLFSSRKKNYKTFRLALTSSNSKNRQPIGCRFCCISQLCYM